MTPQIDAAVVEQASGIALLDLVHLGILLPVFILSRAGRRDQRGIKCRAFGAWSKPLVLSWALTSPKILFLRPLVAESKDRRFVRNPAN